MLKILDNNDNPALGSLLADLRDKDRQQDRARFRRNMKLVGTILGYEIAKTLSGKSRRVQTPLGDRDVVQLVKDPILSTALRAGLPFLDGMLEIYDAADTMFFGAARADGAEPAADGSIKIDLGYEAMAPSADQDVIFVDPMIATGSTVLDIHQLLVERDQKPSRFIVAGLVGWRGAYDRIIKEIPNAEVWYATCDEELNEHGYIVPGLGDAGDLCFGPKL